MRRISVSHRRRNFMSFALLAFLIITVCSSNLYAKEVRAGENTANGTGFRPTEYCSTTLPEVSKSYFSVKAEGKTLYVHVRYDSAPDGLGVMAGVYVKDSSATDLVKKYSENGMKNGSENLKIDCENVAPGDYDLTVLLEEKKGNGRYISIGGTNVSIDKQGVYFLEASSDESSLAKALSSIDPEKNVYPGILYLSGLTESEVLDGNTTLEVDKETAGYIDKMIGKAKNITAEAKSDEEKALLIYGWICKNSAYDRAGVNKGDFSYNNLPLYMWMKPYGTSVSYGAGVCAGFTKLYHDMLVAVGIPSVNIVSKASETELHEQTVFYLKDKKKWIASDITEDVNHAIEEKDGKPTIIDKTVYGGCFWNFGIPMDSIEMEKYDVVGAMGLTGFEIGNYGKTSFSKGEDFIFTGEMQYQYIDGTDKNNTASVKKGNVANNTVAELIQGYNKDQTGKQEVTFSLAGQTVRWEVSVQ